MLVVLDFFALYWVAARPMPGWGFWGFCLLAAALVVGLLGALVPCAYGFGLSLCSYWSISVAPVRGGTYFSLPAAKQSRQKKAAHTASL
jgi:hypothetical protein